MYWIYNNIIKSTNSYMFRPYWPTIREYSNCIIQLFDALISCMQKDCSSST